MRLRTAIIILSVLSFPFSLLHAEPESKNNDVKNIDCTTLDGKPGQNGKDGIPDSHCKDGGKGGDGKYPGQAGGHGGNGADGGNGGDGGNGADGDYTKS
ncbi:hypothetical protein [Xenorhabdus innexi]|uniref:Collagen-like surface protein n=1 Tax=Xenorhabdus innexi TaxID=290109 RepID=A0A1N6MT93_9GAMM|nr:hypothetical protein [Xenorhabdus innexi]PHM36685.1 collagen-like surface protein [Xenorhabdus innexi]SIP71994.1 conserved exported hypothetical protein [Xenorhabdus innexi]